MYLLQTFMYCLFHVMSASLWGQTRVLLHLSWSKGFKQYFELVKWKLLNDLWVFYRFKGVFFVGSLSHGAAEMRTFQSDSLGGIWIVQRNRLTLIGRERHISRAPARHSRGPRQLIGSSKRGRAIALIIYILVSGHLQMIAGLVGEADRCVQCFSTELTWTFLLEQNVSLWDSWESVFLSQRDRLRLPFSWQIIHHS